MGMALILGALPCWASSSPLEEVVQQRVLKATVTLKLDKVGVKVFFSEMKRQTGLDFVCSSELARHLSPITLHVSGADAAQVLDQVLGSRGCQWSRKVISSWSPERSLKYRATACSRVM